MTTQLEQAARQALEALESDWDGCVNSPKGEAVTALRSALEQQAAQEETSDCALNLCDPSGPHEAGCRLAKQRVAQDCQPLTDKQIEVLIEDAVFLGNCKEIVRAIEAAHGIGGKK